MQTLDSTKTHRVINQYATHGEFGMTRLREAHSPVAFAADPQAAADFWHQNITTSPTFDEGRETVVIYTLNIRNRITGWHIVSVGSQSEAIAHPAEIMTPVLLNRAHQFIILHNHPSGHVTPSSADRSLFKRMLECSELFRIKLVDFMIMGDAQPVSGNAPYLSFREAGLF